MNLVVFFFLFIFCKRLHKSFFCSSSTLSQFPGRTRVIGSNVGQISVSGPLLPCVNALSSENKASLHNLLDGGWFFLFLSLFLWGGGSVEILSAPVAFFSSVSGFGVGPSESERTGELNERKHVWEELLVRFYFTFKKKDKCLGELRRTCGFVRVWEERSTYECVPSDHHEDISYISRSLSSLLFSPS